jgi:hypothetical protein
VNLSEGCDVAGHLQAGPFEESELK